MKGDQLKLFIIESGHGRCDCQTTWVFEASLAAALNRLGISRDEVVGVTSYEANPGIVRIGPGTS